jgi:hypothetical protein
MLKEPIRSGLSFFTEDDSSKLKRKAQADSKRKIKAIVLNKYISAFDNIFFKINKYFLKIIASIVFLNKFRINNHILIKEIKRSALVVYKIAFDYHEGIINPI